MSYLERVSLTWTMHQTLSSSTPIPSASAYRRNRGHGRNYFLRPPLPLAFVAFGLELRPGVFIYRKDDDERSGGTAARQSRDGGVALCAGSVLGTLFVALPDRWPVPPGGSGGGQVDEVVADEAAGGADWSLGRRFRWSGGYGSWKGWLGDRERG